MSVVVGLFDSLYHSTENSYLCLRFQNNTWYSVYTWLINERCPCELIIFCLKICLWLSVIHRITSTSCAWQSKPLQAVLDHVSSLPLNCFQYSVDFYNSLPLYLHFLCLEYIILHPPSPIPCLWPGPSHLVNFHTYCKPTVNVMFLWSLEILCTCLTKCTCMIVLWMPLI